MSLPLALLSHETDERMRLYIPSKRRSEPFFQRIQGELERAEGVDSVRTNSLTGSVLISHHSNSEAIEHYSEEKKLFLVIRPSFHIPSSDWRRPSFGRRLSRRLDRLDESIHRNSHGNLDLSVLNASVLFGLTLIQIRNRKFLPPAWTLLQSAFELLRRYPPNSE